MTVTPKTEFYHPNFTLHRKIKKKQARQIGLNLAARLKLQQVSFLTSGQVFKQAFVLNPA